MAKDKGIYMGVHIPRDMDKDLRGYMKRENRSKSYVARKAIGEFLERDGMRQVEADNALESQERAVK